MYAYQRGRGWVGDLEEKKEKEKKVGHLKDTGAQTDEKRELLSIIIPTFTHSMI